jgi:purine-binding chemotaxis protein CheW
MTQCLTFRMGGELYGVDIHQVQEIKGYVPSTPLPNAPPYFKGVMNLRGVIVPVVDLRARFGMPPMDPTRLNVIIVVVASGRITGLLVDAVADVAELNGSEVQAPPDVCGAAPPDFVQGVARVGEELLILLNTDRIVAAAA